MVPRIDARTKEAFCAFERHPSNEAQVRRYTRDEMLRYRDLYSEPPYPGWDLRILLQAKLESAVVASGNTRGKDAVVPWSANRSLSEKEKLLKFVVGNLNRLTPEKYTDVMEVFCDPILFEKEDAIRITVHEIITKALHEPKYTAMYAQACFDIARFEILYSRQQINRTGGERRSRFRAELLKDVQLEFGRAITADIVIPVTGDGTTQFLSPHHEDTGVLFSVGVPPQSVPDGEEQERLKERAVANVRFIAELVHRKMISGKNCVAMLDMLLSGQPFPDERNIELACTLLFIIGPSVESDQSFFEWTAPFERISELSALMTQARTASKEMQDRSGQAPHYCPRIRFMMQDLLDMRLKNWAGKANWTGDHSEWTMQQILRKPEKPVARASSLSTTTAPPRLFAHTPYNKGSHQPASAQSQPRPSRTNGPLDLSSPFPKRAVSERMSNQSNTGDSMPPVEPEITLPLPQLSTTFTKQIHNCVQEIADDYGTEQSSRGLWMDPTVEQEIMHKIIEQILQQAEGHGNPQTDKMRDGDVSGNTRPVEGTGRELFFGSALASEGESVEASPCWDRDFLLQPQGATLVACLFATMIIAACKTTRTGWRNAAILALRSTCPGNFKALEVGFCWVYIQALEQDLVSDTPLFFARFFYMTQHVSESLPPVRVLMLLKRGLEYLEYRYPPSHDGIIDPAVIVSSRGGQDDSSTHHCGDADEYRPGAVMIEEFRLQARDLVKEYIKKYCSVPGSTSMLFTPLPATSRNVEPDKVKVVRADSNPPIRSGPEEQDKGNALSMISFLQDAAHVFGDSFECEISSLEVSAT